MLSTWCASGASRIDSRRRVPAARCAKGYVRSFLKKHALAMMLAAGLSEGVALSQSPLPQTESSLSRTPARVSDWANRLLAKDPKVRATAEAALVKGAERSLPVLRRLLDPRHEDLHEVTLEIIRRIGPPALPLLVDLLRHESDSIRRSAADALIDLAPHTERIQPALRRALRDEDSMVAGDAARALGALGKSASPSVGALVDTLSHEDPYVRIYAAEALASIGPNAVKATNALAEALGDPIPGVRWAACEALASIGPAAHAAVPQLIEALEDEFLYVRIFAAGALGSIGPKAQSAQEALRAAANDPTLRHEAEWALSRIEGSHLINGLRTSEGERAWRAERGVGSPRASQSGSPRGEAPRLRRSSRRAILRLTGIRPRVGTSSGASSWEPKRLVVPWLLATRSMWAPTTPAT